MIDEVFGEVQDRFPIGLKEAKELRPELMEEWKSFEFKHESAFDHSSSRSVSIEIDPHLPFSTLFS